MPPPTYLPPAHIGTEDKKKDEKKDEKKKDEKKMIPFELPAGILPWDKTENPDEMKPFFVCFYPVPVEKKKEEKKVEKKKEDDHKPKYLYLLIVSV